MGLNDEGRAGRGAREQAEKAATQVDEARRRLAAAEQRQRAWEAGALGEQRTAEVLAELEGGGWRALHDLHWPGRPFANIDHIAIGPGGVAVIDSKNWSGQVTVRDGILRQNGYRRSEACDAAAAAASEVAALLEPQHRSHVTAVLALVNQPTPPSRPDQVHVVGLSDLREHLRNQPPRLTPTEVALIADYLARELAGRRASARTPAFQPEGPVPTGSTRPIAAHRRARPAAPSRRRRPAASRPTRRRSHSPSALETVVKLAALALFMLVVLPALLHNLNQQQPSAPSAPATTTTQTPPPRSPSR
jgi:hypothetical protein